MQDESGGRLFRSVDKGQSWMDMTPSMDGATGSTQGPNGIYELIVHRFDQQRAIARGLGARYWVSEDAGVTWISNTLPSRTVNVGGSMLPHPYNPNVMALLVQHDDCLHQTHVTEIKCPHDVFIHQNFGQDDTKWEDLIAHSEGAIHGFLQIEWAAHTRKYDEAVREDDLQKDLRLLALAVLTEKPGVAPTRISTKNLRFIASSHFFSPKLAKGADPHDVLLDCVASFGVSDNDILVASPAECLGTTGTEVLHGGTSRRIKPGEVDKNIILYVSQDGGTSFREACIPSTEMDLAY